MFSLKRVIGIVSILSACFVGLIASAQTTQPAIPEIYVSQIQSKFTQFAAGDTVKGTFVLENKSTFDAPNIYYTISLVGDYQPNTLANKLYDFTPKIGPLYVKALTQQQVSFSYKLPTNVNDSGLGLQIEAFTAEGLPLGWYDYKITVVNGTDPTVTIVGAYLQLANLKFGLNEGPVVKKDQKPILHLSIKNNTASTTNFNSAVDLYKKVTIGTPLQSLDNTKFVLKPKETKDVAFNLPIPENAGVYIAQLNLYNTDWIKQTLPVEVRYIISGDMAAIHSVTAKASSVKAGDTVNLTIVYSGSTIDIVAHTGPQAGALYQTVIKLFNQKDQIVSAATTTIDYNVGTTKVIDLLANVSAAAMRVEVVVSKGDKILTEYKSDLSDDYQQQKLISNNSKNNNFSNYVIVGAILALLVIGVAFVGKKKKSVSLFFVLALCAVSFFGISQNAQAFTTTGSFGNDGTPPPAVTGVSSPNTSATNCLQPGAQFNFTFNAVEFACSNSDAYAVSSASLEGQYFSNEKFVASRQINYFTQGNAAFQQSLGPFTAPSAPGLHQISLRIDNIWKNFTEYGKAGVVENHGWLTGTQDVWVCNTAPTDMCANISGNQTSMPAGRQQSGANCVCIPPTVDDGRGNCVAPTTIDLCWNLPGNQSSIPSDRMDSGGGYCICIPPKVDDGNGNCVDVPVVPRPTVTLTLDSNLVSYDSPVTLRWTSTNATSCSAAWTSLTTTSGLVVKNNIRYSQDFTIQCVGPGGYATALQHVDVVPPPHTVTGGGYCQVGTRATINWTQATTYQYVRVYDTTSGPVTIPMDPTILNQPFAYYDANHIGSGATFTGLPNHSYTWVVQSKSPVNGSWSNYIQGTFTCGPLPITEAPILTARTSDTCGGNIDLSWTTVTNATDYTLYQVSVSNLYNGPLTSFTHSNLVPGSSHTYGVGASDIYNIEFWSNHATALASAACTFPAPTNPAITCPAPGTQGVVSWTPVVGYPSYYLRVYDVTSAIWTVPSSPANNSYTTVLSNDNATAATGFTSIPGHKYQLVVWTKSPVDGSWSTPVSAGTTCLAALNNPPTPPVIAGPQTGAPNTSYTYTFRGTDPDVGDKIHYGIDWDNNGTVDQWLPTTAIDVSGTTESQPNNWSSVGTKTFQALTEDKSGARSGWTSYSVDIELVQHSCVGILPNNTSIAICPDPSNLTPSVDTNWSQTTGVGVTSCVVGSVCKYYSVGSTPTTYSCTGTTPDTSVYTICLGTPAPITPNMPWRHVTDCGDTSIQSSCLYKDTSGPVVTSSGVCSPYVKDIVTGGLKLASFANIGQQVTWKANVTGTTPYTWSTTSGGAQVGPTSGDYVVRYQTIGNKALWINVQGQAPVQCNIATDLTNHSLPIINDPTYKEF